MAAPGDARPGVWAGALLVGPTLVGLSAAGSACSHVARGKGLHPASSSSVGSTPEPRSATGSADGLAPPLGTEGDAAARPVIESSWDHAPSLELAFYIKSAWDPALLLSFSAHIKSQPNSAFFALVSEFSSGLGT